MNVIGKRFHVALPKPHDLPVGPHRTLQGQKVGHGIVEHIVLHKVAQDHITGVTLHKEHLGGWKKAPNQGQVNHVEGQFIHQQAVGSLAGGVIPQPAVVEALQSQQLLFRQRF